MKYVCEICGWVYDEDEGCPESGIAPGTKWEDVPGDFECPVCYVGKDQAPQDALHILGRFSFSAAGGTFPRAVRLTGMT